MRSSWLVCLLSFSVAPFTLGGDWPAFRGPNGNGLTSEPDTPTRWSTTQNVLWHTRLPRPGNGSPIVIGERIFLSLAEDSRGRQRSLWCVDANTGKQIWSRTEKFEQADPTHDTNPYGGTTPVCDGKTVVVWHSSAGLFAYDMDGNPKWKRELGEFKHIWGYGTSPILVGSRVILHSGPGAKVFVSAFDLETGETIWTHDEPINGNGQENREGKYMGSWATPILIEQEGKSRVVCSLATRVCAWDVETGELAWYCEGVSGPKGDLAYSSPVIEKDLCVVTGGYQGPAFGFRMQGKGDITPSGRLWRKESNPQSIGTGLLMDGLHYRPGAGPSLFQCLDAATGEVVWETRGVGGNYWGSIVHNGKHAYVIDQQGRTLVFEPARSGLKQIALNELRESCNTTPALANGRIYIRTDRQLWCIGTKP